MAGKWQTVPFNRLLSEPVCNGIYKPKQFHGHGAKIVNMGELFAHPRLRAVPMRRIELSESENERFTLSKGDLLFARRSLVAEGAGKCSVVLEVDEPTTFESSIIRARPDNSKADPLFLYYFFNSSIGLHSLDTIRRHVAVAGITGSDLSRLEIPVPPVQEQNAIAHILGTLDDKIELLQRMSGTLEAMARTLFKSWFVDFDAVRAKSDGRGGTLPYSLARLFPERLVDSELGEIPEGWHVAPLADHFAVVRGVSYQGSALSNDAGNPLHNLNSIHEGGGYKYEGIKYYTGDYADRHVVRPGEVIVANTEQGHDRLLIGYAAIVPALYGPLGIASHHLYRMAPLNGTPLTATFLCHFLNSRQMHDLVSGYANGTTVNMLPVDALQKPLIVCPPEQLIAAFSDLASHSERRREVLVAESYTLAAFRDALMHKLISGELRVHDADRITSRTL